MIEKEYLKKLAGKLMFDMNDEEYETLQKEFDVILKNMDRIAKIPDLKNVTPMTFPYVHETAKLREDKVEEDVVLGVGNVLKNSKHNVHDQVKLPKVVE